MQIFSIKNNKLKPIQEKKIKLESEIQSLIETNIETIFGYNFIASEFRINNFRFDTLAWDPESKAFIIVEYKKDRNFSIVDQGFAYLGLLLNRKADFVLEYNSKFPSQAFTRETVDWSQSRIVFISPKFTEHQLNSINFKNMAFDLFEITAFNNSTIALNKIEPNDPSESIDLVTGNEKLKNIAGEVKNYTIEDQIKPGWKKARDIFDILDSKILELDSNIVRSPKKHYIGYKIGNKNFIAIKGYKSGPSIHLNRSQPKDFKDPERKVGYVKESMKHFGQHISWVQVQEEDDIDYAMSMIKQLYRRFIAEN